MTFQNLWQIFIYVFRCFDPKRKPAYIDDFEYNELLQHNDPTYTFVIVR